MVIALTLILEGIAPFLAPGLWRETFQRILLLRDGQLRFLGLASMLSGIGLLVLAR